MIGPVQNINLLVLEKTKLRWTCMVIHVACQTCLCRVGQLCVMESSHVECQKVMYIVVCHAFCPCRMSERRVLSDSWSTRGREGQCFQCCKCVFSHTVWSPVIADRVRLWSQSVRLYSMVTYHSRPSQAKVASQGCSVVSVLSCL